MVYDKDGGDIFAVYDAAGIEADSAYDVAGNQVHFAIKPVDYSQYTFEQVWASKGIGDTQGFDIYDGKVFWVKKRGNDTIPSTCYVWDLATGGQALSSQTITIYSGHGNNLCFDFPKLYADSAYTQHIYVNEMASNFLSATLVKTLLLTDDCTDNDACIDETDKSILWSLGHISLSAANHIVSKWNLDNLTDNGDGTFSPELLQSVFTPVSSGASHYYQGCKFHDGMLWYASGYYGSSPAYVHAVNPNTGEVLYTIDCETTEEPEGIAWVADRSVPGGYVLYVGFQGMMLRKYTFAEISAD